MTSIEYRPGDKRPSQDFMIRLDRDLIRRLNHIIDRHPLRPSLRNTVERAIELMIADLMEEIRNGQ